MANWGSYSEISFNNIKDSIKEHISEYVITGSLGKEVTDLKLDIVGEETLSFDSDVTDHYVESNIAYQDQISLKPKVYTINGEVGELVWYQKDVSNQLFGQVAQRLEGVISFLPVRSKSFNQAKKSIMKAAQWVDTIDNAVTKLKNLVPSKTNQQKAYEMLLQLRDARKPINIKTPWGVLENYVITECRITQPKDTKDKSQITISFKEFRTVSLNKTVPFDRSKYYGNAAFENQPMENNGKTSGEDVSISSQVSRNNKNNPFRQIGDTTREGSDYLSQTSDSSEVLNVWYNSESHQFKVTDMYDNIITGAKETQAFQSVENGIKAAINNRYGNPPLR